MKKLLIILLLLPLLSFGTKYYIDPDGSDSDAGTIAAPWFTLNKAWTGIAAGDTIYVRDGTYVYTTQQTLQNKNGTAGNLIKIWNYPGETPTFTRPAGTINYNPTGHMRCLVLLIGNYIHVKGIEITGFFQYDIGVATGMAMFNCNNCIIENIYSNHNGHGMFFAGFPDGTVCTGNLILNCDFSHNKDSLSGTPYNNASGLSFGRVGPGSINRLNGCRFWWNTDEGMDTWNNDGLLYISNCWAWYNGFLPGTFTNTTGDGDGFKFGWNKTDQSANIIIDISNCIAYKNQLSGFDQNYARGRIVLKNNIAYLNDQRGFNFRHWAGETLEGINPDGLDLEIAHFAANNISYDNVYIALFSDESTVEYNSFTINTDPGNPNMINDTAFVVNDAVFVSLDSTQLTRPRLTTPDRNGTTLPAITFLNLVAGSDLVDSGINMGYGNDLGPFQRPVKWVKSAGKFIAKEKPIKN